MIHLKYPQKDIKHIKKNKKNRFFTLLELLFFFLIVTIVSGFISLSIKKSIDIHRLEKDFRLFKEKLFFTKKAALFNQSDLFCFIEQKEKGVFVSLGCNEERGLFPWQKRQKSFYPYLRFQFLEEGREAFQKEVSLTFTSDGSIFPRGKIKIFRKDGEFFKEIDLGSNLKKKGF